MDFLVLRKQIYFIFQFFNSFKATISVQRLPGRGSSHGRERPTQSVWKPKAAPQLKPWLGSSSSPDAPAWPRAGTGHWVEGAESQWQNSPVLLESVHLTPTYACRHLGSWIILAANQEVMGCTFLWKHSLSVCCLSVSVDSLSLRVPFVLLVFICPSEDFMWLCMN